MTPEAQRILNECLCEALEPKPTLEQAAEFYWSTRWWAFDGNTSQQWRPKYILLNDGNAMLKLIAAMRERDCYWTASHDPANLPAVQFSATDGYFEAYGETLPEATALAAARVLGLEVPE